jgi:hypothetical protein
MSPELTGFVGTDHKGHVRRDSTSRHFFPVELGRRIPVEHWHEIPNDGSLCTAPSTSACADPEGTTPDRALLSWYAPARRVLCPRRCHWFTKCMKPDTRRLPAYRSRSDARKRAHSHRIVTCGECPPGRVGDRAAQSGIATRPARMPARNKSCCRTPGIRGFP